MPIPIPTSGPAPARPSAIGRRFARSAAVVLATAGLVFGLAAPAQAAAADIEMVFYITGQPGAHFTEIFGYVSMSQAQAQAQIDAGAYVKLQLIGDDGTYDDVQYNYGTIRLYVSDDGLGFVHVVPFSDSVLDEDSSWWEDARDELYIRASLRDAAGKPISETKDSSVVTGYF